MPQPDFPAISQDTDLDGVKDYLYMFRRRLNDFLAHMDTLNIDELNANVIIANTITADKMNVTQLSAIAADLGTITAGIVTGALIQNQTAEGNRVFIDSTGFHSKDLAGVERLTIGTTPAKGAKALIGRNSAGTEQSVYVYDTETVDGASRTGQYVTAHGCYLLFDTSGDIRIQDSGSKGFRTSSAGYPEMNDGFGWVPIAKQGLAGTKTYYVSDTSGGAVTRKLTFTDGILTSET